MALKLNLIVGEQELGDQFEYIEEETSRNAPSSLFIKGPYMMAEDVNRNNRRYPLDELTKRPQSGVIPKLTTSDRLPPCAPTPGTKKK